MKKIYLTDFLVYQISRGQSQSFELGGTSGKDTINLIDALGKNKVNGLLRVNINQVLALLLIKKLKKENILIIVK